MDGWVEREIVEPFDPLIRIRQLEARVAALEQEPIDDVRIRAWRAAVGDGMLDRFDRIVGLVPWPEVLVTRVIIGYGELEFHFRWRDKPCRFTCARLGPLVHTLLMVGDTSHHGWEVIEEVLGRGCRTGDNA
jgi:hypothetical protein